MNRRVRASPISPSGVRSGVQEIATETMGGVWQEMALFCGSTYFPMLLCCGCLSTTTRPDRAALAVRGRKGATPPFLPLERQTVRGGVAWYVAPNVAYPAPPLGSLPSNLSLREGSDPEPQVVADEPEASPMRGRYPFLIVGGLACSAWGFIYRPFPLPGDDPMLDLVLYHTPNFYAWIVRWYYISAAAATANHEAAKEWDELATHADLCRADIGAGRSPRERLAEFFATCLCGSLLPYAIACGAKVQEGVSSLNGTVLLPGPRCKDPYV